MKIFPNDIRSSKSTLGPSKLSVYNTNEFNSHARVKNTKLFSDHSDSTDQDTDTKKEIFAQDVFDLGYILLVCATGGLDLIIQDSVESQDYGDS